MFAIVVKFILFILFDVMESIASDSCKFVITVIEILDLSTKYKALL
jgi:hypothetical protein